MSTECSAYTCKGTKCTKESAGDYCIVHSNSMKMIGPMRFRQNQERYIAARKITDARNKYIDTYQLQSWSDMIVAKAELAGLVNQHANDRLAGPHTLADQQSYERIKNKIWRRKEIRGGIREKEHYMHALQGDGRDEDMEIRLQRTHYIRMVQRGEMTARDAFNAFLESRDNIFRRDHDIRADYEGERHYAQFGEPIPPLAAADRWLDEPRRERTLAEIAADNQNIHTSEVVKKTKDMVELIRKINVPEEYRWNMTKVSKTMSEIISDCEMSPQAAWQFSAKYCSDETIYEMENGIFGKLTDAVWQHVKASPDASELKKIVKEELEMNIGMCAQGNLSRVANILVGILDGLAPEDASRLEKIAQAIADLRPTLVGKTQVEIRLAAMKVLVPFHMTAAEMKPWVDAIADSVE